MKIAFIIVLFNTPPKDVARLQGEVEKLGFKNYRIYFIDNTGTGRGYAQGVNEGISQARNYRPDYYIICNPDISFGSLKASSVMEAAGHFDIWGFGMRQDNKVYYGGQIDRWRMSGGLLDEKPAERFKQADYVTGSLMVFSRKTVDTIGLFDEKYFMYYEDVDYCRRALLAGLRVGIDGKYVYDHYEFSKSYTQKDYLLAKNRLQFLFTYGSLKQKLREMMRMPLTVFQERSLIMGTLTGSVFVRNFFSLNLSAFIGKVLSFILFLFLVRYLPVRDYGLYILVWAHVTILSPLVDFGTTSYGMVYLPREKENKAISLFSLRLTLSVIIFLLTVLLSFIFRYDRTVVFYVFLVSFVIFYNMTSGMYFVLTSIREEMVKTSVISTVTNTIMIAGLITLILLSRNIGHLFIGVSFFYFAYAVFYFILLKGLIKKMRYVFNVQEWVSIIKKSYVFVLISLFAGIYFKIDVFILNLLKGTAAVGIYSSGYKFFEAMILLASSYNTLSAPSFSKTAFSQKNRLMPKIAKHALFLGIIGAAVVAATYLLGSLFLPYILKGNYLQAIDVVKVVIWALPFILFNSIFLNLLYACELSHVAVYVFLFMSAFNIILNFIFVPLYSYMASSYITVFSEIVNLALLIFLVFVIYRKRIFYD